MASGRGALQVGARSGARARLRLRSRPMASYVRACAAVRSRSGNELSTTEIAAHLELSGLGARLRAERRIRHPGTRGTHRGLRSRATASRRCNEACSRPGTFRMRILPDTQGPRRTHIRRHRSGRRLRTSRRRSRTARSRRSRIRRWWRRPRPSRCRGPCHRRRPRSTRAEPDDSRAPPRRAGRRRRRFRVARLARNPGASRG